MNETTVQDTIASPVVQRNATACQLKKSYRFDKIGPVAI